MLTLPTDPDVYPDEMETREQACSDCGRTCYVPATEYHDHGSRCPECERGMFRNFLDPSTDAGTGRIDALSRLDDRDLFPIQEPAPDALYILEATVDRVPGQGQFLKSITQLIERECPKCGYDRCTRRRWQIYTCEQGQEVCCRVCEHTLEATSSL